MIKIESIELSHVVTIAGNQHNMKRVQNCVLYTLMLTTKIYLSVKLCNDVLCIQSIYVTK